MSNVVWRKASRSTAEADNCIEIASMPRAELPWRKAQRSNESGDDCVELAAVPGSEPGWRKASRSTVQNDNCIEVADGMDVVAVRDSKDPGGPMLVLSHGEFRHFTDAIKNI
ncbi:DUF397 domain-containing protein [Actinomadura napierensis]|uniref:DUF397 domain-containing protein n=1 Tax=Actinomadura napierensis TaxID=267854 RepID=A0ABN2Z2A1_9ACTN